MDRILFINFTERQQEQGRQGGRRGQKKNKGANRLMVHDKGGANGTIRVEEKQRGTTRTTGKTRRG